MFDRATGYVSSARKSVKKVAASDKKMTASAKKMAAAAAGSARTALATMGNIARAGPEPRLSLSVSILQLLHTQSNYQYYCAFCIASVPYRCHDLSAGRTHRREYRCWSSIGTVTLLSSFTTVLSEGEYC
jgi:hypothetical protein